MCLTSKHKFKEKFRFFKEGEACVSSKKKNSKHRILFHKGEACASPLSTSLRRNSDLSRRVRHVPHPKKTNSKHVPQFERKRSDTIFCNQE